MGANLTAFINQKMSAYVNYNAEVGRGDSSAHLINGGFRYEF